MDKYIENWSLKELQEEIIKIRLIDLKKQYELCMILSEKAKLTNDLYALAFSYTFISDFYLASKKNKKCFIYLERARKLCESKHYIELLARIYNFYGMYYNANYEEIKALEYYLKSLDASEECQNQMLISSAYNNIATCFDMKCNYLEAIYYYDKCYHLLDNMNMNTGYSKAVVLSNLCNCEYKLKQKEKLHEHLKLFERLKENEFVEGMQLLYLFCKLMNIHSQNNTSLNTIMDEILNEQKKVENRLLVYQVLKNICSIMLEINNQKYSNKILNILNEIQDDAEIKSKRELQKLIISYYEKFGTQEELLKADQEFYNIILTIEDIDMVDNSGGLSATIELYRTKERQVSLEKENEQLEKLMNTDDLTQVFNRRCFNNDIINQTLQNKSSVAVAMIDIDYFKQYNDIYGHQMGDQALIEVGKCMNKYNREGIVRFYRYGGDEFTVIFIDQSEENVCEIMDSLINDIKFKEIPHKGSKTDCILTLSYGYAICTGQKIDIQALIKQADEQLYQHKKLRRLVTLNKK